MQPEIRELRDETRREFRVPECGRPVRTYVWEPVGDDVAAPPVVLVSHGTGGSARSLAWLAEALAAAGFLAVAVEHHGNNSVDTYLPEGFLFVWERPRDLRFVLDTLAGERPLGPVGAAGFSLGGYTAAALLGARLDEPAMMAAYDGGIEGASVPEFPDAADQLRARGVTPAERETWRARMRADHSDARVRAAFLVCPMGVLVSEPSLAGIDRPLEIRWGDADVITPPPCNALRYLHHVPTATGRSAGPDVEHYHYLGHDPDGGSARAAAAADAVTFFRAHLTGASAPD